MHYCCYQEPFDSYISGSRVLLFGFKCPHFTAITSSSFTHSHKIWCDVVTTCQQKCLQSFYSHICLEDYLRIQKNQTSNLSSGWELDFGFPPHSLCCSFHTQNTHHLLTIICTSSIWRSNSDFILTSVPQPLFLLLPPLASLFYQRNRWGGTLGRGNDGWVWI